MGEGLAKELHLFKREYGDGCFLMWKLEYVLLILMNHLLIHVYIK